MVTRIFPETVPNRMIHFPLKIFTEIWNLKGTRRADSCEHLSSAAGEHLSSAAPGDAE